MNTNQTVYLDQTVPEQFTLHSSNWRRNALPTKQSFLLALNMEFRSFFSTVLISQMFFFLSLVVHQLSVVGFGEADARYHCSLCASLFIASMFVIITFCQVFGQSRQKVVCVTKLKVRILLHLLPSVNRRKRVPDT